MGILYGNMDNLYNDILNLIACENEDVSKENSNKNATILATQRDLVAGEISKDITKKFILPKHIVEAHEKGIIHFHDLDFFMQPMINCCLLNLEDMLDNGTVINEKLVESPKGFCTACTVTTQIIAQLSSNQYGGLSFTIKHLAPYLRKSYHKALKEYMKYTGSDLAEILAEKSMLKDLRDGIQTIRYQLSTLQSTHGQAPFSTIYLEIIEGHKYEKEMALICEEMINQRIEGMKNYKGQVISETFPKLIYALDTHNSLHGGKYDYISKLAAVCNAKRMVPDYQSVKIMKENYEGNNFPAMGCRSHLSPWKDNDGNYKWYGRFNQGVVSLNLPQMAILADKDLDKFWDILDERMELAKEALMYRHKHLKGTKAKVSPIHWMYGGLARLDPEDIIDPLLMDGYSTISLGYVGLFETVKGLLGVSHTSKEGEELTYKIMNKMKNACDFWKQETGLGFGLYGTPAESLIHRFCKLDRENFGEIEGITDKLFYTNSYHVDVRENIDAFSKLTFESPFHKISSGGCISYIEVPNLVKNTEAIEQIIKFIYNNIQYAEINTKPDICYVCGFEGELLNDTNFEWYCPSCGNRDEGQMQVLRRTCGYIGSNYWSKGRTSEIKERVLHL